MYISARNVQELEPERPIDFSPIKRIMEHTCEMKAYLERLDNTEFVRDKQSIERELGRWVNNSIVKSYDNGFGKVKLATSLIIDAYKNLFIILQFLCSLYITHLLIKFVTRIRI